MKTTLIFLMTVLGLAMCRESDDPKGPELRDDVMLYANGLAYDGCEQHVVLNWNDPNKVVRYAPDAESVSLIDSFLGKETQKQGDIIYKFTGLKKTVQCGWGSKFEADEITIVSIR
ncbi:hypothetical protein ACO2Q8_05025 [Larkinella sp. VNQ87]|uniref:hypothetical protein n=1 Tax=Larkinella sp. VNQ87 TaxID=3400921 RepID=UPI003BFC1C1B